MCAALKISPGEPAVAVGNVNEAQAAELIETDLHGVGLKSLSQPVADIHHGFGIGNFNGAGTTDRNALQVLGADDAAVSGSSCSAPHIVKGAGKPHHVFAGRPDEHNVNVLVAQLFFYHLVRLAGEFAPQVACITDLDLVVIDPDIDRMFCPALNDNLIIAGIFQLCAPVTAHVGVTESAGERALAGNGHASC